MIKELSKFDLPSGYNEYKQFDTGKTEPLLTPENMTAIWNKLNELIDYVNQSLTDSIFEEVK